MSHKVGIRHVSPLRNGGRWLRRVAGPGWYVPFLLALGLTPVGLYDYLLFHTLVEVFAVVIATMVAAVAWNTYAFSRNDFLMFLGVGYFWVGILHLVHALLYKGMGVFPVSGADAATQLWLLCGYLESAVLFVAPWYLTRKVAAGRLFWLLGGGVALAGALVATGHFPHAYLPAVGLTRFKIDSEYLIIGLYALAWVHLWRRRGHLDQRLLTLLRISILFSILAEAAFTFYANVNGPANLIGHLLKLLSVWWIYTALVESSLSRPIAAMARGANSYDAVPDPTFVVDRAGTIRRTNAALREEVGLGDGTLVGRDSHALLHPAEMTREACPVCRHVTAGRGSKELELAFSDGRYYEFTLSRITWAEGESTGMVCVRRDITRRKVAEAALLRMNRALRTLSYCNQALIHGEEEAQLLRAVCAILVKTGGYRLAWVGVAQEGPGRRIEVVATAGDAGELPEIMAGGWGEEDSGPVGEAIRTAAPRLVGDVATDPGTWRWRQQALEDGIGACASLPLLEEGRAFGVLTVCADDAASLDAEELALLEELGADLAYGVRMLRAADERDQVRRELDEVLLQTIEAVALTVEKRDPYTAGHQHRVAALAEAVAAEMGLPPAQIEGIRLGGIIHDIGKIYIPAEIINRPGRLSDTEMALIRTHSEVGYDIIRGVPFPWPVKEMILQHHERLDGSGYPRGLKGEEIIPEARILAVADVVEAMTSHRPYRAALGLDAAIAEIEGGRGTLYDERVADACIQVLRERGVQWEAA